MAEEEKEEELLEEEQDEAVEESGSSTTPEQDVYDELTRKHKGDYKKAMFEYCYIYNIPFCGEDFDLLLKHGDITLFDKMPQIYVDTVKADPRYEGETFFSQLKMDNFEKIYAEDIVLSNLPEESRRDREQIIKIIGYDPFEKHPIEDKPQLYRDLTGMLTDSMRKDIPRAKAAVEVVTGYNNIRKYQERVNDLISSGRVDENTQEQIDNQLQMIAKMQDSVNKISEKNGFTNSKSLGTNGKGMLSDVMQTIDEHMYDPGITNFYDIATSQSIKQISDISVKAMLNQVKLTGQEYVEILAEQNKIVREAQSKMREIREALRLAKSMLTAQQLIEKLKQEYIAKGISEDDINEFIDREYSLWSNN